MQYTTSPQSRDDNVRLVSDVYSELALTTPDGLRYATFLLDEGDTFIHLAVTEDASVVTGLPAFQAFQRDLASRVVAPPEARSAQLIGSYRLL